MKPTVTHLGPLGIMAQQRLATLLLEAGVGPSTQAPPSSADALIAAASSAFDAIKRHAANGMRPAPHPKPARPPPIVSRGY